MNQHEFYIKRCLELAKNGLPFAMPNPSVGAVVVVEDTIIGEGFTSSYGGNHAEVNAINSIKDKSLLLNSTLYVSLEPCSHFGKTPPCADLIVKHKIPNVVIGTLDSNEKVSGNGVKKLQEAGINVTIGILEKECFNLNKRFFTFHNKKRPYIILKWAESFDGFIAPFRQNTKEQKFDDKKSISISNEFSRQVVHKWRSEEQAILVGTTTVLNDNPKLNVRDWTGKNPIRVVIDKSGKITPQYYVKDESVKTIVITEQENVTSTKNLIFEKSIFDLHLVNSICEILYKHEIQSVLIEGGTKTLQSFIDANLWDEARIFKSDSLLGFGIKSPQIEPECTTRKDILNDKLLTLFNYD